VQLWAELAVATAASLGRMLSAYVVSLALALVVGTLMARSRSVERVLLPLLDILQSIPILGFFPAALALFVTALPADVGVELAAVFLITTSLVWNMIFGVYASLKSLDPQLEAMATVYRFGPLSRFFYIYAPASRNSLVANSLVSWAGGWFFLTSSEVISLGAAEYRLRGLGSFILDSFARGDVEAFYLGVLVLLGTILLTYLLVWNPAASALLGRELPGVRGFYSAVHRLAALLWRGLGEAAVRFEGRVLRRLAPRPALAAAAKWLACALLLLALAQLALSAGTVLGGLARGLLSTLVELPLSLLRVALVVALSFLISMLVAYLSYRSRAFCALMSVSGELLASIPAIVWWPLLAGLALSHPLGPYLVSFIVFLQGSFWYLYFNVLVYGLSSVRRDLEELAEVYRFRGWPFYRYVFLPSLLPSVATGALSAWGGAWNASIVAEYVELGDGVVDLGGAGALIAKYAAIGDLAGLVSSVLTLSLTIVAINKTLWARLFRYIEERYGGE